jgi:hypothetical protein
LRKLSDLTGSVVTDPGFCIESATRPSGSPRLSSLPATMGSPLKLAAAGWVSINPPVCLRDPGSWFPI